MTWRKVIASERFYPKYAPHGASTVHLQLECGHEKYQKGSKPIPRKASCRQCEMKQ